MKKLAGGVFFLVILFFFCSLPVFATPHQSSTSSNPGSLFYSNQTVNIAGDLAWGNQGTSSHGAFGAYYSLGQFQFDADNQISFYNPPDHNSQFGSFFSGPGSHSSNFGVDTTNQDGTESIHFDLQNNNSFSLFSYDGGYNPSASVPEPAAFVLLGFGIMGLAVIGRKNRV
jgi:hypothetical protein